MAVHLLYTLFEKRSRLHLRALLNKIKKNCGVLKELCAIRDNTSLCDIVDKDDIAVLIKDICIN